MQADMDLPMMMVAYTGRFEGLEKEKEAVVGEGERNGVLGRGQDWDEEEVEDDFAELAGELNEAECRRERAYEEGMAWIRREFGDGDEVGENDGEVDDEEEI
ncbi:hypothetical protein FPQ18DRAFT_380173 [Pyronema domesticum]|nr:hypothetical protein FPQ18DRAFT_380173 [Pyronema domesticum]